MTLGGQLLIDHVLQRIQQSKLINTIVLATPDTAENDVLAERAQHYGIQSFRGSEDDLVGRFYNAAVKYSADVIVRVCADNPLLHASEVDRLLEYFLKSELDFASNVNNVMDNGYPDGIGAEVMTFSALKWVHNNITDPFNREHPHTNFYDAKNSFKIGSIKCPKEFSAPDVVLDINTAEEYEFMSLLFSKLSSDSKHIHILDIIPWYRTNYHLTPDTYRK